MNRHSPVHRSHEPQVLAILDERDEPHPRQLTQPGRQFGVRAAIVDDDELVGDPLFAHQHTVDAVQNKVRLPIDRQNDIHAGAHLRAPSRPGPIVPDGVRQRGRRMVGRHHLVQGVGAPPLVLSMADEV